VGETQNNLYRQTADEFGPALQRLARAYESNPEKRRDLAQDIHFQLWRSFAQYDARCSLRTWIYHHVAASSPRSSPSKTSNSSQTPPSKPPPANSTSPPSPKSPACPRSP
jgi:hypothetical protein